jgi:hypothetical protein
MGVGMCLGHLMAHLGQPTHVSWGLYGTSRAAQHVSWAFDGTSMATGLLGVPHREVSS